MSGEYPGSHVRDRSCRLPQFVKDLMRRRLPDRRRRYRRLWRGDSHCRARAEAADCRVTDGEEWAQEPIGVIAECWPHDFELSRTC